MKPAKCLWVFFAIVSAMNLIAVSGSAQSNTWSSEMPMPTARFGTAVGIINGKVYVVTGATATAVVNNNEVYNPTTNTWTTATPITTARFVPASAVVNGILYVIGGCIPNQGFCQPLTTVEAYNAATQSWSTKASLPVATHDMYAVVKKGIIYVVGGYTLQQGDVANVFSYNPATDSWTSLAPLNVAKAGAATGTLGGIIAAGGLGNGGFVSDNERYSILNDKWITQASMPNTSAGSCFGTISGKFYVASGDGGGGNTLEVYSALSKSWTTLANIPQAIQYPASAVYKSKLYCFGGANGDILFLAVPYDVVQIYHP